MNPFQSKKFSVGQSAPSTSGVVGADVAIPQDILDAATAAESTKAEAAKAVQSVADAQQAVTDAQQQVTTAESNVNSTKAAYQAAVQHLFEVFQSHYGQG